ncbi:HHL1 [Auxenochlorella protothecoides x Auxenochlorella symbiontica]|uniref:Uncharacterized protein n=1 Tax=Auxenochlorella protothecoides TaxID=3075 RepID=A0A1D2ABC3_AUXPR
MSALAPASCGRSFFGGHVGITAFTSTPAVARPRLVTVRAAKGKQRLRQGGRSGGPPTMPKPPTPEPDPKNEEFVMFVRSKKLMKWVPLSIMKGGTAANMLVKSMQGNLGKKMYTNTLIRNIAQGLYKDRLEVERQLRNQYPFFKETKEFEYAFKIRDKTKPEEWYLPADLIIIPPEEDLEDTVVDKAKNFFGRITGKKD